MAKGKNIKLVIAGEDILKKYSGSTKSDYKNYIIMSNLVGNAIKYSPKNSVVEMGFNVIEKDNHLHFFIKDKGIGIPEKDQAGVLKSIRASNVEDIAGSGYGLYRTNSFVKEAAGGELKITSPLYPDEQKYKGTMFECPLISDTKKSIFEKLRNNLINSLGTWIKQEIFLAQI